MRFVFKTGLCCLLAACGGSDDPSAIQQPQQAAATEQVIYADVTPQMPTGPVIEIGSNVEPSPVKALGPLSMIYLDDLRSRGVTVISHACYKAVGVGATVSMRQSWVAAFRIPAVDFAKLAAHPWYRTQSGELVGEPVDCASQQL